MKTTITYRAILLTMVAITLFASACSKKDESPTGPGGGDGDDGRKLSFYEEQLVGT